ncbi:MAG: SpaA isopeptide-forming pilin-related protein, partial [Peptoniphilus harei]|nr:SpaA isopeptide-forming pilin-related protein [Peptoniphilus harei]
PFKVTEQIDKTLKEGQTKIKVKGVEGLKTTTTIYEVDKKTGKLINPKETVIKKDPVDQIVLKGTKPDSIKTSIEAKVKYFGVGGAEEKPEAGKYKFVLKDNQGKVVSEATNDKNGNIVFKELNITDKEIGSHKYTVEQVKGDDLTIEYDTHIEDVTVNVSLSDDNKLSAKVTYDKDGAVFGNRLNTTSIQFVRLAEGEKPFVAEEVKNNKGLVVSHKISDKDKAKTIDGAEYDIYKINSDGTETKVTSIKTENGISNLVENLVPGKYKLKETKSPEGYFTTSKDIEFEITKEDAGKALVKFVSGEDNGAGGKIMEMPSTGGQGTKALMIGGGALLIVMAGVFVLANKKKKELNK